VIAHPFHHIKPLLDIPTILFVAGFTIGIGIGLVSSVLGVAGGEL
jgi:hypothetical protein